MDTRRIFAAVSLNLYGSSASKQLSQKFFYLALKGFNARGDNLFSGKY